MYGGHGNLKTDLVPKLRRDLRIQERVQRKGKRYWIVQDVVLKGWDHPGYRLSDEALLVGRRHQDDITVDELVELFAQRWSIRITRAEILRLVKRLDNLLLLENERSQYARHTYTVQLRAQAVRPVANTGYWYAKDPHTLRQELEACFLSPAGPGRLPIHAHHTFIQGIWAPHASLVISGACASWAYLELAESDLADLFILIGPNHVDHDPPIQVLTKDCETPLGTLPVDRSFVTALSEYGELEAEYDTIAHFQDHSLEMQYIFLQYLRQSVGKELSIVPLLVCPRLSPNDVETTTMLIDSLAQALRESSQRTGRRLSIIVSGDLTHYGSYYNFSPFGEKIDASVIKQIRSFDNNRLQSVIQFQPQAFLDQTQDTNYCARWPVYTLLKTVTPGKVRIPAYGISNPVRAPDGSPAVSSFACAWIE